MQTRSLPFGFYFVIHEIKCYRFLRFTWVVFLLYLKMAKRAAPNIKAKNIINPIRIANQINVAFAQFALLGLELSPNAQTKSIINPTRGIAETSNVTTHSPVFTTWSFWFSILSEFYVFPTHLAFRQRPVFILFPGLQFVFSLLSFTKWRLLLLLFMLLSFHQLCISQFAEKKSFYTHKKQSWSNLPDRVHFSNIQRLFAVIFTTYKFLSTWY